MKKHIHILFLIQAIALFSCNKDFLTKDNPTATTDEKWWKLESDLKAALNVAYGGLPCGTLSNYDYIENSRMHVSGAADESVHRANFGDWQNYPLGLATNTAWSAAGVYTQDYKFIRNASRFLEHYESAYVEDPDLKKRYAAEARALRAWYHLELFLFYGNIPIVDHSLLPDEAAAARATREDVITFIATELEKAAQDLPPSYSDDDSWRMTKGSCYAMQSILYINAGDYTKTIEASRKLIDLGVYELYHSTNASVNSYAGLFSYDAVGSSNKERIFFRRGAQNEVFFRNAPKSLGCQSATTPTAAIVNAYETLQGKTIFELGPDSVAVYTASPKYKSNRDPRLNASILVPNDVFVNRTLDPFTDGSPDKIGQPQSTFTGFWTKKYLDPKDASQIYSGSQNFMIIRYAEILLNYAEALIETDAWQNPDVVKYLNEIRNRAGMPNVDVAVYNSKDKMRELLRRERQVELAFEGPRLFDIRRWKIAEQVLNGPVYGAYDPVAKKPIIVEQRTFNLQKDYVWPIPLNELNANRNMVQNPGW